MLEVVAAGAVSDYGEAELASLRTSIAAAASVDASDVNVTIAPGSVILTARIAVPSAAAATLTAESLASQLDSSASASTLLSISVEETPAVRATTEVVIHPAPSPPLPPPPLPPQPLAPPSVPTPHPSQSSAPSLAPPPPAPPLPAPSPSWWVDGAPPGWLNASVAEPADTLQYADSWQFTSTDATQGVHPLGALSYDLPLVPFDASQGDLHSVHMLFTAVVTFEGLLGDAGGGSGGAASGECAFSYGDGASSHTSHAFYGTGAGSGGGGGPNQMDRWDFNVRGELLLTAGMESAVLGLSSASYADAGEQQCDAALCRAESLGMTQIGMCGPVCAGDAADRLTQLTWRPHHDWTVPTMFHYVIDSGSFVYVNVTLQVDVSVTFRYRATPPLSPFAPPPPAPPLPAPPLPSVPSPSLRPPTALAPSTPGVAAPSPSPSLPSSPPSYPGTPAFQEETGTEADMTAQSSDVLSTGAIVGIVSALAAVLLLGLCIALIVTGKMRVVTGVRIEMGRLAMKPREDKEPRLQVGRLGPPAKTSEIAVLAVGEGEEREGEASPPAQPGTVPQLDVEVKEEWI